MKMRHKHRMPLGMGLCEPYVHLGARTRKSLGSCAKNTGAGDRLRHAFFVPCTHTSTPERLRRSLYTAHRIVANMVCSLVPNHTATPPPESDDFEPTAAELRAAFSGTIAGRHGPHAPLMTSAMREKYDREHGKSKKQYDFIRIRVRFSDRTQIERTFPHNATILDVYDAVDHVLWEEHDHGTYVLFQSPPRRNFPRTHTTDTLRSLGFAPAAVLSIQWSNPSKNGTLCYDQQASCSHSGPH